MMEKIVTETEMKEIARDEFRSAIQSFFSTKNDMYNLYESGYHNGIIDILK